MTADPRGTTYELVVRGELSDRFGVLFDGMRVTRREGTTVLTGPVRDQAQLHGVIERIQELGMRAAVRQPTGRSTTPEDPHEHRTRHIVLVHGFWVTPRSWEDWIAHYETGRLPRARARLPRLRGRGRGAQRRPVADRGRDRAADHRAPRGGRRRARQPADHHGPLGRRRLHPGPARPRLRRRRRGASTRRPPRASPSCRSPRSGRPSRCSRTRPTATRPSASPSSSGTTRSPTPSARSESRAALRALPHPRVGLDLLGQRPGQHPPRQGRQPRRLPQRRPRAAAVHLRQRGSPDAAVDPAVQRQALQVRHA